jgi:uncharacterized membrane protein
MNRMPGLAGTAIALLVMLVLSALAWSLPPGSQIAIHWDVSGHPNGYADKNIALAITPLVTLGLGGLFYLIPNIEPRRNNLAQSARAYNSVWLVTIFVMVLVQTTIVLAALGMEVMVNYLVPVGIGAVFLVMGAVLGKVRSNFVFGIRTPWTLSSDRSWEKTHILGGRLMVALGIATIAGAVVGIAIPVVTVGVVGGVVVTVLYSYLVWRDERHSA